MSWILAVALLGILAALVMAGLFMLRRRPDDGNPDKRMQRALAARVALSVALFLLILFSYWMGWISPTGVPLGR
jgi:hypothetical protein